MHQAFYRKYRPQIFDDVCGQDHITSILKYECSTGNLSHAYLFCGSRGTGKTSCAKILSKAINCESPVNGNPCGKCPSCVAIDEGSATDVVEMDAASNRSVDDIRILRDEVGYTPSFLKKRVYIIDEVHMLTREAFNALLKTLEEPPEYVVFILATTELQKLPATIISRCQRFDFRRITIEALCSRLEYIARNENIFLAHDAAARIARVAQGGMRDAISLFELCAGGNANVDVPRVEQLLGLSGYETLRRFTLNVAKRDISSLLSMISDVQSSSQDISVFWGDVASFWRDMMIMKAASDPASYLDLTETEYAALFDSARSFSMDQISFQIGIIDEALWNMSRSPQTRRQIAEFAVLRLVSPQFEQSTDALLSRFSALEDRISLLEAGVTVKPTALSSERVDDSPELPSNSSKDSGSTDDEGSEDNSKEMSDPDGFSIFSGAAADSYAEVPDPSILIEKLGPNVRSFVQNARIEINSDGDKMRVVVDSPFAEIMLTSLDRDGNSACDSLARAAILAKYTSVLPAVDVIVREEDASNHKMEFDF